MSTFILLSQTLWLGAQIIPATQDPIFWDGRRMLRADISNSRIEVESPVRSDRRTISLDASLIVDPIGHNLDFTGGRFRATRRHTLGANESLFECLSSIDGMNWEKEAVCHRELKEGRVWRIFYLQGKQYLLISVQGFRDDKSSSPFALAIADDNGQLRFSRILGFGMKEPYLVKQLNGSWGWNPKIANLASGAGGLVVRTPDHLVLIASDPGYFWTLDTRSENPALKVNALYPSVPLAWDATTEYAVLGAQPTQFGDLLVAARTEEAVLHAREDEKVLDPVHDPRAKNPIRDAHMAWSKKAGLVRYPKLQWFEFDPEKGKFAKVDAPPGAPFELTRAQDLEAFSFQLSLSGSIKVRGAGTPAAPRTAR